MKKIFFLVLLFVCFQSYGQRFPSIDSLQNYILRYIKNSSTEAFTNLRMQNVVYGLSELLESRAVDSIWRVAGKDSIFFRKNNTTFAIKDSIGGGGSFVPYTGATNDVDLGNFSLNAKSFSVTGTGGNGHIHLRHQSSAPNSTGNSTTIYADANGNLAYKNDGFNRITFNGLNITSDRTFAFQNKSYTIGDSADIAAKQDLLVSGTNIKTINGSSILGSGNLSISGGGGDSSWVSTETGVRGSNVGVLINENFSGGSLPSGWAVGSFLSPTYTGSKITITGADFWGAPSVTNQTTAWGSALQYNSLRMPYEKMSMEMTVVPTTKSAGGTIALTHGSNGFSFSYRPTIAWNLSNDANSGRVAIGLDSIITYVKSTDSTSKIEWSANDTLVLSFSKDGFNIVAGIYNKTTGKRSIAYFNEKPFSQGGRWNWVFLKNSYVVTNIKVTLNENTGGTLFTGHSRAAGFGATDETRRYANLVYNSNSKYFKVVGLPSISARYYDDGGITDEVSQTLQPDDVVIDIGGNDIADWFGTPAQIKVYVDSIGQTYQRNGASSITLLGQYPSSATLNILNDTLRNLAAQRSWVYVDVDTTIQSGTTSIAGQYSYDGAHYSDSGQIIIAGKIIAKNGVQLFRNVIVDTNYTVKFKGVQSAKFKPINLMAVLSDGTGVIIPNTLPEPNKYIENRYSTSGNPAEVKTVAQKNTVIHIDGNFMTDSALIVQTGKIGINKKGASYSNLNITGAGNVLGANNDEQVFDNFTGWGNIKLYATSINKPRFNAVGTYSGNNNTIINATSGIGTTLSGSDNISIGNYSDGITSGSSNIFMGQNAGKGVTTGSNNLHMVTRVPGSFTFSSSLAGSTLFGDLLNNTGGALSLSNYDVWLSAGNSAFDQTFRFGGLGGADNIYFDRSPTYQASNRKGTPWYFRSSRGYGNATGGNIIFQTWNAGASGTTINSTANTELTIENDSIQVDATLKTNGQRQIATKLNVAATGGYTVASTDHYIDLPDLAGQANRTLTLPTNSGVGRVLIIKNKNSDGGNTWSFNIAVKDKADADVTAIANDQVYHLLWNGTNWVITMLY